MTCAKKMPRVQDSKVKSHGTCALEKFALVWSAGLMPNPAIGSMGRMSSPEARKPAGKFSLGC